MFERIIEAVMNDENLLTAVEIMCWILSWVFAVAEVIAAVVILGCALFMGNWWLLLWYIPLLGITFITIYSFLRLS